MKKFLLLLLASIFVLSFAIPTFAEDIVAALEAAKEEATETTEDVAVPSTDFDLSMFDGVWGYDYDKFEKTWGYNRYFEETYSDCILRIYVHCAGDENGVDLPPQVLLMALDRKKNDLTPLYEFTGLSVLIGDDLYEWPIAVTSGNHSSVFIYEGGKDFLKALADANPEDVAMKLKVENGSLQMDSSDWNGSFKDLQDGCRFIYDHNMWQYCIDEEEMLPDMVEYWPMIINDEAVTLEQKE